MTKAAIIDQLVVNHRNFLSTFLKMSDDDFMFSHEGKWSAGQQLDHIYRALKPLTTGLNLPKWLVRLIAKKANRPSRSYDELIEKYKRKLQEGGKASGRFVPQKVEVSAKEKLLKKVDREVSELNQILEKFNESELDTIVLPHPLLGYITLREMMYFTIYHAEHHRLLTLRNLESKKESFY